LEEGGERLFTVNRAMVKDRGPLHQVDLAHVLKVFRELIRCLHDLLRQKPPSLLILQGWNSISVASLTLRLNSTLTISTDWVAFVSVNHGSLLSAL
jgi:hypothetical protein